MCRTLAPAEWRSSGVVTKLPLPCSVRIKPSERLLVLDWQHPSWWFRLHRHALADTPGRPVEIFPPR
ncbi:DUF2716 domain-containing protein [Nonomuraea rhodomycinica]|uniref:DUF2716 domain-containing protein n=1 Tax=Nonomuraea rhodomycinica TaxID=1712872 RepID=A0A7Y6IS04_9ACTN|nr:DUF2716 domain-containing protein [Nonomuraea rhodomycinica]